MPLNNTQIEMLESFFDPEAGIYLSSIIEDESTDALTKIIFLKRAIEQDNESFMKSLDKLHDPNNIELIRALKTINDVCFDNEIYYQVTFTDARGTYVAANRSRPAVTHFFHGTSNPLVPAEFREQVKTLITKGLDQLKQNQDQLETRIQEYVAAEQNKPERRGWRRELGLPEIQPRVQAAENPIVNRPQGLPQGAGLELLHIVATISTPRIIAKMQAEGIANPAAIFNRIYRLPPQQIINIIQGLEGLIHENIPLRDNYEYIVRVGATQTSGFSQALISLHKANLLTPPNLQAPQNRSDLLTIPLMYKNQNYFENLVHRGLLNQETFSMLVNNPSQAVTLCKAMCYLKDNGSNVLDIDSDEGEEDNFLLGLLRQYPSSALNLAILSITIGSITNRVNFDSISDEEYMSLFNPDLAMLAIQCQYLEAAGILEANIFKLNELCPQYTQELRQGIDALQMTNSLSQEAFESMIENIRAPAPENIAEAQRITVAPVSFFQREEEKAPSVNQGNRPPSPSSN